MNLKNVTELQKKVNKAVKGYEIQEVIHTFEVLKLYYITRDDN